MGKLDQYCFDGTNALSLKKLPTDSKKDQVDKEKILAKTEKNQEKIFALQDKLYADAKEGCCRKGQYYSSCHGRYKSAGCTGFQLQAAF